MEGNFDLEKTVRPDLTSKIDYELGIRGVALKKETLKEGAVEIPVIPKRPAVIPGQEDEFVASTKRTLSELGIPLDTRSSAEVRTIDFLQNVPKEKERGVEPYSDEGLRFYIFEKSINENGEKSPQKGEAPLVIFSHGGKIHPDVIQSSGYLPVIFDSFPNMILCAVDHRGSQSHEAKVDYGLDDRVTDLLVAMRYAIDEVIPEYESKGIKWNGKVVLFGDSIGGHVVSVTAGKIPVDGVILTEPASYSVYAEHVRWGKRYKDEPVFGGPEGVIRRYAIDDSFAFESIERYAKNNPDGKVLIIEMEQDTLVVDKVGERKTLVPTRYRERIEAISPEQVELIKVPGKHGATPSEEIRKIKEFLGRFK